MNYRPLGRTGMMVSPLCLGNMMFGAWGNADHDDASRIIHRALDHGINFVDTADVYSAGESEVITGQALAGSRRDGVILATKAHFPLDGGPFSTERAPNMWGNSRRHIVRACEDSLRRLGTDWIDLYQMHRPDPNVPLEETLSALTDLVHQGKIRAFGCSTFPAEMIVEGEWIADRRGLMTFATEQPPYSIFVRGMERDLLPGRPALQPGRAGVEPAERQLADRAVPQGPGGGLRRRSSGAHARPLRSRRPREPTQVRPGRGAGTASRRAGPQDDAPGAGLRAGAPGA